MENNKRSKSIDLNKNEHSGRYLPNGKLNITARWNSPGLIFYFVLKQFINNSTNLTTKKKVRAIAYHQQLDL